MISKKKKNGKGKYDESRQKGRKSTHRAAEPLVCNLILVMAMILALLRQSQLTDSEPPRVIGL